LSISVSKVLDGLKTGNDALKKIHDVLSVDDIERILDETREGVEKQQEIDALLSNNLSPEDLEAVETELEKIMAEENVTRAELSPDEDVSSLPDVPVTPLPDISGTTTRLPMYYCIYYSPLTSFQLQVMS
jgi:charged multivesicular body protein 6